MTGFLISFLLLGVQRPVDQARISIALVDIYGSPLAATVSPDFKLTNRRDRKMVFTAERPVFENIPYGQYDLEVLPGQGFGLARRIVDVRQKDVWIIVGLPAGRIDNSNVRSVSGRVQGISGEGQRWTKLFSLYSDVVKETRLDANGGFTFTDVPYGRYLLLVLKDRDACDMRAVDIVGEPHNLDIQLGPTTPCK